MADSDKLFVAAIDFGTTYSGYAFSSISDKRQVYTFSWRIGISQTHKTQTSILFNPSKQFHSFGFEAEEEYASLSKRKLNKEWYFFKRFKLTLHKNLNLNESTLLKDFTQKEMPAIDVFSGGIRYLKEHLISNFRERLGFHVFREKDIHWVLTVPAIWDEAAKKFMRKSAEEAGIPGKQLTLALEPESAALYCQLGMQRSGINRLNPGDKFILLDCGGGTVDVTVHKVRHDKSLKELHRASGGPWGGIKVDDAFQEYLCELVGFEAISSLAKDEVLELEKNFESLKRNVDSDSRVYKMQLPLSLRNKIQPSMLVAGRLKLESEVVKGFFKRTIGKICDHIEKIITSLQLHDLSIMILVGGFAESPLLQAEIRRNFQHFMIHAPSGPGSAVVKGAVEFGHCPEKIRFRLSPYTYGVDKARRFNPDKDPMSKLKIIAGKKYCKDIFDVHVTKNQEVKTGTAISDKNYYSIYPDQKRMAFQVVTSSRRKPNFIDDPRCRVIGSFNIRIPKPYRDKHRPINVKMIFSGTELIVEAKDELTERPYTCTFNFE